VTNEEAIARLIIFAFCAVVTYAALCFVDWAWRLLREYREDEKREKERVR
jgi:hypothetical protein